MKTTNKFDYPTATSQTYKKYRKEDDAAASNLQAIKQKNYNRHHYKQVIQD